MPSSWYHIVVITLWSVIYIAKLTKDFLEFKLDRIETSWSYNIHNSLFKCNEWKQFGGRNCYHVTWITRQNNEENLIDLFKTLSLYKPDIDNKSKRILRKIVEKLNEEFIDDKVLSDDMKKERLLDICNKLKPRSNDQASPHDDQ